MARKRREPEPLGRPEVEPEAGKQLLESQIQKGQAMLEARPLSSNAHSQWELLTRNYLEKVFGKNSPNVSSVTDVGKSGVFPMNAGAEFWERRRAESLATQVTRLQGLVELLDTELRLRGASSIAGTVSSPQQAGHRIFVAHGHDQAALQGVARLLERLGQDVIVLREQPNQGRTIIEKFEDYADVGFAVVLLTPDDRGGSTSTSYGAQHPRARQNVILELGYFLGRLGRSRVCALYAEGVEVPSDYSGVVYVRIDSEGAWRFSLAKELKAAGFRVDMNEVF